MAAVSDQNGNVAPAQELSEWSQKFYNGTFKWDDQGFTDDNGVYREFDCYDPLARAPTPLPPVFLSEDEYEEDAIEALAAQDDVEEVAPASSDDLAARQQNVVRLPFGNWSEVKSGSDGSYPFASILDTEPVTKTAKMRNDSIFSSEPDKELMNEDFKGDHGKAKAQEIATAGTAGTESDRTSSNLHHPTTVAVETDRAASVSPQTPTKITVIGKEKQEDQAKRDTRNVFTTPSTTLTHKSSSSPTTLRKQIQGSSDGSDLSDCPSNISDADVEERMKINTATPSKKSAVSEEEEAKSSKKGKTESKPDANSTPRKKGIAQKIVRKKTGESRVMESTKRTDGLATLLAFQSGAYMLDSNDRRRSTRQAQAKGKRSRV